MGQRIVAEMSATVWQVAVTEGQSVTEGVDLVVLEAMKMEIPVVAETDGVVQEIAVSEGDAVKEGDVLLILR